MPGPRRRPCAITLLAVVAAALPAAALPATAQDSPATAAASDVAERLERLATEIDRSRVDLHVPGAADVGVGVAVDGPSVDDTIPRAAPPVVELLAVVRRLGRPVFVGLVGGHHFVDPPGVS